MSEPSSSEKKTPSSHRRKRWLKIAVALVALSWLILVLLPFGVQYGLKSYLEKAGAGEVEVGDVDLNLFTGRMVFKGLKTLGDEGRELGFTRAAVDLDWRPLLERHLQIRKLELSGATVDLRHEEGGGWSVGRLFFPPPQLEAPEATEKQEDEGEPWGFGIVEIALDEVLLRYSDPLIGNEFRFERLHTGEFFTWTPDADSPFDFLLHLTQGTVKVKGSTHPFAQKKLLRADLDIEDLDLGWLAHLLEAQDIKDFAGNLSAKTHIEAVLRPSEMEVETQGRFALRHLKAGHASADIARLSVAWDGETRFSKAAEREPSLSARGKLSSDGCDLSLASPALRIRQEGFEFDGDFSYGGQEEGLLVEGGSSLRELRIEDTEKKNALTLGLLELKELRFAGPEDLGAAAIVLGDARLLERPEREGKEDASHVAAFKRLSVEKVEFGGEQLRIGLVDLSGADLRVARDSSEDLDIAFWLPKGEKKEGADEPAAKAGKAGLKVRIGKVKVAGESRLVFTDQSVSPSFRQVLQPMDIELDNIDSAAAGNRSPVAIDIGIGPYGTLEIGGDVEIFAERPTMELEGKLEALDLHALTPYTAKRIGYSLWQGQLGADLDWKLEEGIINSVIALRIDKLDIEKTGEGGKGIFGKILGMPLDTALSQLRDGDDNIALKLPIEGDLDSPHFSMRDVLYQATSKAIQKQAVSHFAPLGVELLTGVVLPPGTLFVAGKMIEWAMTMRFKPVEFAPMAHEVNPETATYLDEMAALLMERPKSQVVLSAKTVLADRDALRTAAPEAEKKPAQEAARRAAEPLSLAETAELEGLAEKRAMAVKDYLIAKGVGAGRLLICTPVVEEKEGVPMVEVSM